MKYYVIMICIMHTTMHASESSYNPQPLSKLSRALIPLIIKGQQKELQQLTTEVDTCYDNMKTSFQEYQQLCHRYCKHPELIIKSNFFDWMLYSLHREKIIIASIQEPTRQITAENYFEMAYQQLLFKTYRTLYKKMQPTLLPLVQDIATRQAEFQERQKLTPIAYTPKPPRTPKSTTVPSCKIPHPPSKQLN